MTPTANGSRAAAALSVAVRIINAADMLCTRGAEPQRAGSGGAAVADPLSRILALADTLRSVGVEPHNVIHVLRWVAMPLRLATMVCATWAIVAGFDDDGSDHHERRDVAGA